MKPADYRKGDTVESPIGIKGIVASVSTDGVLVQFVDWKRTRWETTYTAAWFEKWPQMLRRIAAQPKGPAR